MKLVKYLENTNEIVIDEKFITDYKNFQRIKLAMELEEKELKEELKEVFEETGKTSILLDGFSVTYKKPTTRTSIDSKRLKEEQPELFEEYSKTSEVAGSITIKVE